MGCDIHAHLEIKVEEEWLYYGQCNIGRSYSLFAKMANVRNYGNEVEPISTPRGLPTGISKMVKFHRDDYGIDGHSDSYLSYQEIRGLIEWGLENLEFIAKHDWKFRTFGLWLFGNSIYHWQEYPSDYPAFIQDVRLVFWFDN